jgi:hypothetical protein
MIRSNDRILFLYYFLFFALAGTGIINKSNTINAIQQQQSPVNSPIRNFGIKSNNLGSWLDAYREDNFTWMMSTFGRNYTCYGGRVLYPFGPECADIEVSKDMTRSQEIDLGFNLTFMGHSFNKAWVNQHGIISFQESFLGQTLSQEDWPNPKYPYVDDPVFIAPLYAQTDLAGDKIEDLISTKYGRVLYKVLHRESLKQIYTEEEKFIYQMSMAILDNGQKEIRDTVSGCDDFVATHALIATWKSVSFLGNSLTDIDLKPVKLLFIEFIQLY